jgi:hypothetical protein
LVVRLGVPAVFFGFRSFARGFCTNIIFFFELSHR